VQCVSAEEVNQKNRKSNFVSENVTNKNLAFSDENSRSVRSLACNAHFGSFCLLLGNAEVCENCFRLRRRNLRINQYRYIRTEKPRIRTVYERRSMITISNLAQLPITSIDLVRPPDVAPSKSLYNADKLFLPFYTIACLSAAAERLPIKCIPEVPSRWRFIFTQAYPFPNFSNGQKV